METIGFIFGLAGAALGIMAHKRMSALEAKLKELKILEEDYSSGEGI